MLGVTRLFVFALVPCLFLAGRAAEASAQEQGAAISAMELPDAPLPQSEVARQEPESTQTAAGQEQSEPPPVTQASDAKGTQETAEEQIKRQEHQRMLGIIPSFNTSYIDNAVSLSPKQKIQLAFRSVTDPYAFGIAAIVAGLGEAEDSDPGFGWGIEGYGKRVGAKYLDAFNGNMIGNAFLPILLHQDPRYFRLGHGSIHHRLLYAVATSFICKHDKTGKWEPNYSNVGGNIISGALSNYYYPSDDSGIGQTIGAAMTVTVEGTFGAALQEFWPDIARKFFHKDPTNGLDAKARAADEAKKRAKAGQQ